MNLGVFGVEWVFEAGVRIVAGPAWQARHPVMICERKGQDCHNEGVPSFCRAG
jgi:hypothetical protein